VKGSAHRADSAKPSALSGDRRLRHGGLGELIINRPFQSGCTQSELRATEACFIALGKFPISLQYLLAQLVGLKPRSRGQTTRSPSRRMETIATIYPRRPDYGTGRSTH
jgi:hypothetical protein